jgi:predicted transcriptional regulator
MPIPKISDLRLIRLVDEGKSQVQIAEIFGVSRQAVHKRLKELRGRTTKVVVAKKIEQVVDRKIDAMQQLTEINGYAREILDLVMRWIRGEDQAIQVLESKIRTVNVGTREEPEFVKEFKFTDPHSIALKAMAEIRGQLSLQLDILKVLYDFKAVEEFQKVVLTAIGKVSPEIRDQIIRNLNAERSIRSTVEFH